MSISAFCLHCSAVLKVDNAKAGRTVSCPKCGNKVQVPPLSKAEVTPELSWFQLITRWSLNLVFLAVLVYLYQQGGLVEKAQSYFQQFRPFFSHWH
ncbi:MAG: hypothetical protein HZC54_10065 [Verrucomicrobia bacterium]|nr:hypothetical protein [Verrucomicrobiota bacterium]